MTDSVSSLAPIIDELRFLTEDYLPEASWSVEGAFRYDKALQTVARFLRQQLGIRQINRVSGGPACLWNLDWHQQRPPMPLARYTELLEQYARMDIGVTLTLDHPFLSAEMLNDVYGNTLVQELVNRDRVRKNAVCVASDLLAQELRRRYPKLPVYAHVNRLIVVEERRTASLYNRLAEQYQRVALHPVDAVKPTLFQALEKPGCFDVTLNDICLRTCPVRREHLRLLAERRREPYEIQHHLHLRELVTRTGCLSIDHSHLQQKRSCNLTREEAQRLDAAGFHSWQVQSQQFSNEITLLWDIFVCMFGSTPELSNKYALIVNSCMAEFGRPSFRLPSGLSLFSFNSNAYR